MRLQSIAMLAAGAALISGLCIQAPATLLAPPLSKATGERLQLAEPTGTIWAGSGNLVCKAADFVSSCGRLGWRLDLSSLARGMIALQIDSNREGESAHLSLTAAGWQLDRINLTVPAALLGSFDEKLAALGLGGTLRLQGTNLTANQGALQVRWQHASTRLVQSVDLGEHQVDLINRREGRNFTVGTLNGPLKLNGVGSLAENGAVKLDMEIQVIAADSKLTPLLTLMGQETSPGLFQMHLPAS